MPDANGRFILFCDRAFPEIYRDLLGDVAVMVGPDDADLAEADGVIAGAVRQWDAAAFAIGPKLKVISRTGVGYDNVDVAAANDAGVAACYAPSAPAVSTAEHTIALLCALTKGIPAAQARANAGLGPAGPSKSLELDGSTLGLVGLGRIATRVAIVAQALGMTVTAYDPVLTESPVPGVVLCDLSTLLRESHVVSLHAPGTVATKHLINDAALAQMRAGSYLVNCARGSLVDQDALVRALDSGHIAGAALDVTTPEPLPESHPLLNRADVIVTPHIASSTAAGQRRLYEHAIANALAVLQGKPATLVPSSAKPAS
jgi:D-3-phosphoglycerate dehydrogenase / 2-oxoglutarate reductase